MNNETRRTILIASLIAMEMHPGNRERFMRNPTRCIRDCQYIADLVDELEHGIAKEQLTCPG